MKIKNSAEQECHNINSLSDWLANIPQIKLGVWTAYPVRLRLQTEELMRFAAVALTHGIDLEEAFYQVLIYDNVRHAIADGMERLLSGAEGITPTKTVNHNN